MFTCLSAGFQAGLHGIGDDVDEKLIELAVVGLNHQFRATYDFHL